MKIKQLMTVPTGCCAVYNGYPRPWRETVVALAVVCRDGKTDELELVTIGREGPKLDAADTSNFLGYETPAYFTSVTEWLEIAKLNGVK